MMREGSKRIASPITKPNCSFTRLAGWLPRARLLTLCSDIRFWILACFLIRLFGITQPPLEVSHNWRQTLGTMVIRNFYETDANILYPRIDIGGDRSGIAGMEFPLFNYLGFLVSSLFGYQHWYGRIINLIVSSLGTYMFYKLIRDHLHDQRLAFYATLSLLFSLWFSFSRKIMPDTFSMSLIIAAVYFGFQYLTPLPRAPARRWLDLLLFGVLATTGMLTKLPSGYLLSILAVPFFKCLGKPGRMVAFATTALFCLGATGFWYGYWVPYLSSKYQVSHFYFGTGMGHGFRELSPHVPLLLKRFYETALKYTGFAMSLYGLGWAVARKNRPILIILLFCFPLFGAVILVSGYNFAHHTYYIIPYVPVMALLAGVGFSALRARWLLIVLIVAMGLEGGVAQLRGFRVKAHHGELLALETDLDRVSTREALIAVNGSGSPTAVYFAHRKGWSLANTDFRDRSCMGDLQKRGLQFIVILNRAFGATAVALDLPRVVEKDAYTIYRVPR